MSFAKVDDTTMQIRGLNLAEDEVKKAKNVEKKAAIKPATPLEDNLNPTVAAVAEGQEFYSPELINSDKQEAVNIQRIYEQVDQMHAKVSKLGVNSIDINNSAFISFVQILLYLLYEVIPHQLMALKTQQDVRSSIVASTANTAVQNVKTSIGIADLAYNESNKAAMEGFAASTINAGSEVVSGGVNSVGSLYAIKTAEQNLLNTRQRKVGIAQKNINTHNKIVGDLNLQQGFKPGNVLNDAEAKQIIEPYKEMKKTYKNKANDYSKVVEKTVKDKLEDIPQNIKNIPQKLAEVPQKIKQAPRAAVNSIKKIPTKIGYPNPSEETKFMLDIDSIEKGKLSDGTKINQVVKNGKYVHENMDNLASKYKEMPQKVISEVDLPPNHNPNYGQIYEAVKQNMHETDPDNKHIYQLAECIKDQQGNVTRATMLQADGDGSTVYCKTTFNDQGREKIINLFTIHDEKLHKQVEEAWNNELSCYKHRDIIEKMKAVSSNNSYDHLIKKKNEGEKIIAEAVQEKQALEKYLKTVEDFEGKNQFGQPNGKLAEQVLEVTRKRQEFANLIRTTGQYTLHGLGSAASGIVRLCADQSHAQASYDNNMVTIFARVSEIMVQGNQELTNSMNRNISDILAAIKELIKNLFDLVQRAIAVH